MFYIRGFPFDYDRWAELGNPKWNWKYVLEYMKKSEGNRNADLVKHHNGKYHNDKGPLTVDYYGDQVPKVNVFIEGAKEKLGVDYIDDINADRFIGYFNAQGTVSNGRRQSTAKTYLIPAKNRTNLHIIKHAHVQKFLINNENEATGVEFIYKGKHTIQVKAAIETILSAGAVSSPQVLMLSGIGPKSHLDKHKIDVKQDLPVGRNLRDHVVVPLYFQFDRSSPANIPQSSIFDEMYKLIVHNTGLFTNLGASQLVAFLNSKNDSSIPDYQTHFFFLPKSSWQLSSYLRFMKYDETIEKALIQENSNADIGIVWVILLRPKSTGFIELKSNSANDKPRIVPNYFSEDEDMITMIRSIKQQLSFSETEIYRKHEGEFLKFPLSKCDQYEFKSDEYFRCYVQHFSRTLYHPVGTSKMGPDSDTESVVDSQLNVKGIKRLRQADAGISK